MPLPFWRCLVPGVRTSCPKVLESAKDFKGTIDIGDYFNRDGDYHFFQLADQMVYFDKIVAFLNAAQFGSVALQFNLCFGSNSKESFFRLNDTKVGDKHSNECSSAVLIQDPGPGSSDFTD